MFAGIAEKKAAALSDRRQIQKTFGYD